VASLVDGIQQHETGHPAEDSDALSKERKVPVGVAAIEEFETDGF